MTRQFHSFPLADKEKFKLQMLNRFSRFNIFCFLDSNGYTQKFSSIEWMLAAGAVKMFSPESDAIVQLDDFCKTQHDWLFGHLSFDLKNEIEDVFSGKEDRLKFPGIFLFQPDIIILPDNEGVKISSLTMEAAQIFTDITACELPSFEREAAAGLFLQQRISKEQYSQKFSQSLHHIQRGDCYEINFCMEFFAEEAEIRPLEVFLHLNKLSPAPFSCFYRLEDKFLISASPERFLKKDGTRLISQPIKGTRKRDHQTVEDEDGRNRLYNSRKDRIENVMVVDLVRNDLNKIAVNNSVKVEELFGIYSFPLVHQMISTVTAEIDSNTGFAEIIKANFPMPSMTGVPKKRVLELIEEFEESRRGIYSGCVGYIDPAGDFDFNVVIRSIMYNQSQKYLSYQVGGGLTSNSKMEEEYEECLIKAKAMECVLGKKMGDGKTASRRFPEP